MVAYDMGVEEAMTVFGTFLSIFIATLLISLFVVILCFSVEDENYLVAGLMIIAIMITILGVTNFTREEQPVVEIDSIPTTLS